MSIQKSSQGEKRDTTASPGWGAWVWLVYLALFVLSVPWYLPADDRPALWLGLPYWVVISLGAVLAIACFTLWLVLTRWPVEDDAGVGPDDRGGSEP
ncbi:MAG: hypothetical protein AAF530_10120 [Pseudomonadota bacterium]